MTEDATGATRVGKHTHSQGGDDALAQNCTCHFQAPDLLNILLLDLVWGPQCRDSPQAARSYCLLQQCCEFALPAWWLQAAAAFCSISCALSQPVETETAVRL